MELLQNMRQLVALKITKYLKRTFIIATIVNLFLKNE